MKKLLILLALPLLFNSCLKDDEDKFPKSASERLEAAVNEAIAVLQGAENGWRMELYPENERIYGGYTLFLKFNPDNSVVASSEYFGANNTKTSYYSIVAESGPVLAFDTHNEIIHFYSSPTTGAELGIGTSNGGLEGDFDFVVMEATADHVKLKGRKTNNYAYLYPLEAGVSWKSEMQSYVDAADKMDLIYTRCVADGITYPIDWEMRLNNFTSRVFRISYTPSVGEDGSVSTAEVIKAPFIFTETGIKFYSPLTIGNAAVSEMTFKENYYFESEDGSVKIYSPKPVHSNNRLTIDPTEITFSSATVNVTPTVGTDYYYLDVYEKSDLEGQSDKKIISSLITEMNSLVGKYTADDVVSQLGKKGAASKIFDDLSSETDYVVIGFGFVATENVVLATTDLFKKEFTTEKSPELDEAYAAWLGTWTVTSTSSTYTKKPLTFDVIFKQKVANASYSVEGWTASIFRDEPDQSPYFPVATFNEGGFYFANGQTFGKFNTSNGTATLTYCCFFTLAGKNYYSSQTEFKDGSPFVSLYGTMNSNKQSAVVKGAEVNYGDDGTATMDYADFMYLLDSGKGAMGVIPGEGFKYTTPEGEDTDFPIGPYTLKKKSPASSSVGKSRVSASFALTCFKSQGASLSEAQLSSVIGKPIAARAATFE